MSICVTMCHEHWGGGCTCMSICVTMCHEHWGGCTCMSICVTMCHEHWGGGAVVTPDETSVALHHKVHSTSSGVYVHEYLYYYL